MLYSQIITIPAGGVAPLSVEGNYFRYRVGIGTGGTAIKVTSDNGVEASMMVGEDWSIPSNYKRLRIQNNNATDVAVDILYGVGKAGGASNVVVSNALTISDVTLSRVKNGLSFYATGASAGTNSSVQLWNPVGSGQNIFVRAIVQDQTGTGAELWLRNTQIAVGGATYIVNKAGPSAPAVAAVARASVAGPFTPGAGSVKVPAQGSLNNMMQNSFEPFMIPPGWGLTTLVLGSYSQNFVFDCWME